MGVNIRVYKIIDQKVNSYHESWDSVRYSGDSEFALMPLSSYQYSPKTDMDGHLYRPSNFDEAENWVKENIPIDNQDRFFKIFEEMKIDPTLYFFNSW